MLCSTPQCTEQYSLSPAQGISQLRELPLIKFLYSEQQHRQHSHCITLVIQSHEIAVTAADVMLVISNNNIGSTAKLAKPMFLVCCLAC